MVIEKLRLQLERERARFLLRKLTTSTLVNGLNWVGDGLSFCAVAVEE